MTRDEAEKIVFDWARGTRPAGCAERKCPDEGLQVREDYVHTHRYEVQTSELGPSVVHRAFTFDECGCDVAERVVVFCPSCLGRVTFSRAYALFPDDLFAALAVLRGAM